MDRAQGIHGGERAVLSPERWRVQYDSRSRRYFWYRWYVWDACCAAWPLDPPRLLLALALLLLGLHRRQDLQLLRDKIRRIRPGG